MFSSYFYHFTESNEISKNYSSTAVLYIYKEDNIQIKISRLYVNEDRCMYSYVVLLTFVWSPRVFSIYDFGVRHSTPVDVYL